MEGLPTHLLTNIMDKASPWTAYCMALTSKDMLRHYESGQCPHSEPGCFSNRGESISTIFPREQSEHSQQDFDESGSDDQFEAKVSEKPAESQPDTCESDTESVKSYKRLLAQQELEEQQWLATRDVAGRSQPFGDLRLRAMDILSISGYDFQFVCDNGDGPCSERQLLLIDDYFKITKGDKYESFVVGSGEMKRFKASFRPLQYKPCVRDAYDFYPIPSRNSRQIARSTCGLLDHKEMSPNSSRGYECIGFDVQPVETPTKFRVKLELYDAETYVS